jgi:hypothetical protein
MSSFGANVDNLVFRTSICCETVLRPRPCPSSSTNKSLLRLLRKCVVGNSLRELIIGPKPRPKAATTAPKLSGPFRKDWKIELLDPLYQFLSLRNLKCANPSTQPTAYAAPGFLGSQGWGRLWGPPLQRAVLHLHNLQCFHLHGKQSHVRRGARCARGAIAAPVQPYGELHCRREPL